jgi:hypothetical protein
MNPREFKARALQKKEALQQHVNNQEQEIENTSEEVENDPVLINEPQMNKSEFDDLICFVEKNIIYRREELLPDAVGLWKTKYEEELQFFERILLILLEKRNGQKPTDDEVNQEDNLTKEN